MLIRVLRGIAYAIALCCYMFALVTLAPSKWAVVRNQQAWSAIRGRLGRWRLALGIAALVVGTLTLSTMGQA